MRISALASVRVKPPGGDAEKEAAAHCVSGEAAAVAEPSPTAGSAVSTGPCVTGAEIQGAGFVPSGTGGVTFTMSSGACRLTASCVALAKARIDVAPKSTATRIRSLSIGFLRRATRASDVPTVARVPLAQRRNRCARPTRTRTVCARSPPARATATARRVLLPAIMTPYSAAAARIAADLDAMIDDGELERAAYSLDDLRAALGATPEIDHRMAHELDALEAALEQR